ncbi:MAG: ferric reductase-like transmembrane domain-containing protein [Ilumatobacteraceae bacterium]|mgnify:FL=1|jgi:sulfoxide reductase heme-binding subunit YedZ|nr:ferric reductase-like transmembrane domain-containing protein [Acidimicrobiaceae bacterium]MBP6490003.1 ferric reductase-like transmembrane domain-containing protein [Ilumatobacteraceae bacterium]MBK9970499.1 ferric reductase-like transmembrane domain-containing protein [Acidimicrobiaceae bacterium]MBP7890270.1 ferric reductase-like transmembrane domain-containing protein [Ilumatobacteraceae bacterium]MBP8209781.1 ferric reductase-like transmembrane domain-containing protein [Ilumatobacterac
MNEHSMWYLSRASGMIAWIVLGITCLWGILLITRMLKPADRPAWLLDLHRYLGVLSLVTVGAHMATLVGDNWVYFGWRELFVPQASVWRTAAVTWGVLAFYLLMLIQLSSWVMKWLPRKLWHAIHLLSYVLFVMVTVHGFMAGSDSTNIVFFAVACGGIAILLFAFVARVLQSRAKKVQRAAANAALLATE